MEKLNNLMLISRKQQVLALILVSEPLCCMSPTQEETIHLFRSTCMYLNLFLQGNLSILCLCVTEQRALLVYYQEEVECPRLINLIMVPMLSWCLYSTYNNTIPNVLGPLRLKIIRSSINNFTKSLLQYRVLKRNYSIFPIQSLRLSLHR